METMKKGSAATEVQVGGDHYKNLPYQPVKFIAETGCSFCQGNVIKYVCRWRFKNGLEDLRKAIHYCRLAMETRNITLLTRYEADKLIQLALPFVLKNKLSSAEALTVFYAVSGDMEAAEKMITAIVESESQKDDAHD